MERRQFIKSSCLTCFGSIGAMWLLEACGTSKQINNYEHSQNKITIKKTEFIVTKKDKTTELKYIVLKPENLYYPVAVYKINPDEYKALFLQCTHQGCELSPYETTMVCPCHGAEFNNKGEVITGPAEINLKSFITTHDNENIYIQL